MRRGFSPNDQRVFSGAALVTLKQAVQDLCCLLDRGYPAKGASAFVGNHHQLTERQRIALVRTAAAGADVAARLSKRKQADSLAGETVNIDGFNEIITLEVALSGSPVLLCTDGAYRDLAGLRGTYRLIDKTELAVGLILSQLKQLSIHQAVFWLDSPVSNSGRLKTLIRQMAEAAQLETDVHLVGNADSALYGLQNVISSDSVILDRCPSWFNLKAQIIPSVADAWVIDLRASAGKPGTHQSR